MNVTDDPSIDSTKDQRAQREPLRPHDRLLRVRSGGSTGRPKLLLRAPETWIKSAATEAQVFGITDGERYAVLGHPDHSLWAYAHFRAALHSNSCLGLTRLNRTALQELQAFEPTVLHGVPELVRAMANLAVRAVEPLPSVRLLLMGGGPMPPLFSDGLVKAAFPKAQVWTFYGAAETSFMGYAKPLQPFRPFPTVQIQIQDGGLIWVKSPMTMSPDEWVNTGDLGQWVDEPDLLTSHFFRVIGRASRQLPVKGRKFAVEPVEHVLKQIFGLECLALVTDAHGLICLAHTVEKDGALTNPPEQVMTLERVNHCIRQQSAEFPLVRRLIGLPKGDWPVTTAGKIDWSALSQRVSHP